MSVLDKTTTLILNKAWQPIGTRNAKSSLIAMNSRQEGEKYAAMGLDISYAQNEDGSYDFDKVEYINPLDWDSWVLLPVRQFDLSVRTTKLLIRIPRVIITGFTKMPMKRFRPTKSGILARDKFTCQYTGEKLTKKNLSIDHVTPLFLGGRDEWTNLVACKNTINFKKGCQTNEQAGLKLIRRPVEPLPIPVGALITEGICSEWNLFLLNRK